MAGYWCGGIFMLSPRSRALLLTAVGVSAIAFQARGQAVISTRSGVVHYFEGAVYLNDQPLEPRLGRFPSMPEGAELRTAEGRAEVLLTPGVFLRIDQNSAIRMVSSSLADSRIELLTGSAMVDSAEPAPGTSVTLTYQDWQVRFPEKGVYRIDAGRIDSTPGRVWVREGEAEVTNPATGEPVAVERGMDLPLAAVLVEERSFDLPFNDPSDALSNWSRGRADSISADNQIAANIQDPASMTDPNVTSDPNALFGYPGQFTQFPMLGLAPINPVVPGVYSPYGGGMYSSYPYQPGFYSLYLPGYTYRPLFLGLPTAVRGPMVYTPLPRTGYTITTPRYAPPTVLRTVPAARPVAPAVRPIAPSRAGGRR
jgi:hypothetical protein